MLKNRSVEGSHVFADVLQLTETNLDNSYLMFSVHIDRYLTPFQLNQKRNSDEILTYIRNDIPRKLLTKYDFLSDNESLIEAKLSKMLMNPLRHIKTRGITVPCFSN